MNEYRWQWFPIVSVIAGVSLILVCALSVRDALGNWQYGIYAGGAVVIVALFWFRRRLSSEQLELEKLRSEIASRETGLKTSWSDFRATEQQFEDQVEQQTTRLDKREEDLANKLIAYHEWTEFPQPIDLSAAAMSDAELTELANKDRQMIELLEEESKRLFEKIRKNEFSVDGKFQAGLLRDDAYELVNRVARIYRPDVDQAMLETSIAQVMQAASRACLHFLVVVDRLPLNIKEYNINNLYGYVQTAVKAYGVYKFASPFMPYLRSAYYLGRYAMGTNPVSLGAWWFAGALSKKGATALATKVVNQHALVLLHDVIRVIGFEVAGIYGGGFRHRDANWIYGTELTELICHFPPTHESLSHALKEIGALQLRSEYDRVYLYRLLSEHKSAGPEQYRSDVALTGAERQAVAGRLERFLETFVDSKTRDRIAAWQDAVESRLRLKLKLPGDRTSLSSHEQAESAIRSLVSFLSVVKLRDPGEWEKDLAKSTVFEAFDVNGRQALLSELQDNPPSFFEQPDLDPAGKTKSRYFHDLVQIAAQIPPYGDGIDDIVLDCAAYLRADLGEMRTRLDGEYLESVQQRFPNDGIPKKIPANVARSVLNLLEANEQPRFIYGNVAVESPKSSGTRRNTTWLVGVGDRIVLLSLDGVPRVLWRSKSSVDLEDERSLLSSQCRIRGGEWLGDGDDKKPELSVAGPLIGNYDNYFRALKDFTSQPHLVENATDGSLG